MEESVDLNQLAIFIQVAELSSFTLKVGESVHYLVSTPKYFKNSLSLATDSVDHR